MARGLTSKCEIGRAWEIAANISAATYGVAVQAIMAESRGRGPRPPEEVREPKKIAVFLAVVLADCDYAQLAREIRLHKDTIASHCDGVRQACAENGEFEDRIDALVTAAAARAGIHRARAPRLTDEVTAYALLLSLHAKFDALEARLSQPSKTDEGRLHPSIPDDHGNVISAFDTERAA